MTTGERRNGIMEKLRATSRPISASVLANDFGVSRQIIVGDIALLRAEGMPVNATPRGYVLSGKEEGLIKTVVCTHSMEDTAPELYIMVDNGCTVIDVSVEHSVYGMLSGELHLSSRYDVSQFIHRLETGEIQPLSSLTGGVHTHRIKCTDEECYKRTYAALRAAGFIYE